MILMIVMLISPALSSNSDNATNTLSEKILKSYKKLPNAKKRNFILPCWILKKNGQLLKKYFWCCIFQIIDSTASLVLLTFAGYRKKTIGSNYNYKRKLAQNDKHSTRKN
ncbi:MAG: hypothetical protein WBK20_04490, partial [Spirochaetota bacterium]